MGHHRAPHDPRGETALHAVTLGLWLMLLGAMFILPIAAFSGPLPDASDVPIAVAPALVGLAGSYAYWLALRDGMLSIVSPTVAVSGGIGAIIAILLLGERFSTLGLIGIGVAVAGVVLATFTKAGTAKGVWWAVLAAVLLGLLHREPGFGHRTHRSAAGRSRPIASPGSSCCCRSRSSRAVRWYSIAGCSVW